MKGHKLHHSTHKKIEHHIAKHRKTGGRTMESPEHGTDDAEEDLKSKPMRYNESKVEGEAEERKRGGRAKRKHGGHVKHMGEVHGHKEKHADRKPRKRGGSCEANPFSSARAGKLAPGREVEKESMG